MFHRRQYAMAMGVYCNASRITRVSPRVLPGVSTFPSFFMPRPTRGGIGAGGFNTDAGGVVNVGAGDGGGDGHRLRHGDVNIPRRCYSRSPHRTQWSMVLPRRSRCRANAKAERGVAIALKS